MNLGTILYRRRLVCAAACVVLFWGCRQQVRDTGWTDTVTVETLTVADSRSASQREYVGTVGSEVETDMGFPLGGKLTKVAVANGQRVKKGQLLAEVDGITARSLHATAQATLRQAEDAWNRMKNVYAQGGISEVRWVQMETDLEKARQAEVAARKRVEDCALRAPFDGVVSCGRHQVGEELKPMETFCRLIDMRRLRIVFSVPEQEVGMLGVGTQATATIPALDDKQLAIRITDKSLLANPLGHTYRIYAAVGQPGTEGLLPDMVAKVNVEIDRKAGIVVPAECVQVMPEGTIVWVVRGGKAYHQAITVRDFVRNGVAVESGLIAGDSVVLSGFQKLYTGAKVQSQGRATYN